MSIGRAITFSAWIGSNPVDNCAALNRAADFDEAEEAISGRLVKGVFISILRHDAGQDTKRARFYLAKENRRKGHYRAAYDGGRKVFVPAVELKLIFEMPMSEFQPKRPFDALLDDPVGVDRALIEGGVK